MNNFKFFTIFLSLTLGLSINAQTSAERNTLSAAGGEMVAPNGDVFMFDVGGVIVNTTPSGSSVILTQGFEQPDSYRNTAVFDPPNAFSPDGDGVNDTWIIPLSDDLINNIDIVIFNRWGDEIANIKEYNNLDNVWDGTYKKSGEPVTNGTFFYIAESPSLQQKFTGWIQVVR